MSISKYYIIIFISTFTLYSCNRYFYVEKKGVVCKFFPTEFNFMRVSEYTKGNYEENLQRALPQEIYLLYDPRDKTLRRIDILNGNVNLMAVASDSLGNRIEDIYKLKNVIKKEHYYKFDFQRRVPFINYLVIYVDNNFVLHKVEERHRKFTLDPAIIYTPTALPNETK